MNCRGIFFFSIYPIFLIFSLQSKLTTFRYELFDLNKYDHRILNNTVDECIFLFKNNYILKNQYNQSFWANLRSSVSLDKDKVLLSLTSFNT